MSAVHWQPGRQEGGPGVICAGRADRPSSGRQEGGPGLSRAEGDGCEPGFIPGEATSPTGSVRTGRADRPSSIKGEWQ
jgi:hypothetical protein